MGTGGLIVAYRAAAAEALDAVEVLEKTVDEDITVAFEYPFLNSVMRIIKDEDAEIIAQSFQMDCEMTLRIRRGAAERLKSRLTQVEPAYLKK